MGSFGLLKTNVKLTTNIKVVCTPTYNLYLESIDSNEELTRDRFKQFRINDKITYDTLIPKYYEDLNRQNIYEVKYEDDIDITKESYNEQFDFLYFSGCNNIENQDFDYDYECFAPLHFDKDDFPKDFFIFRVDKPGLLNLTKENFKEEIVDKFKVVERYDLTNKSSLGKWIERSFTKNDNFPKDKVFIDFRKDELSNWNGIDYQTGGYTEKSFLIEDIINNENTFYQMDKLVTSIYEQKGLIYPNIINFNFLFNDIPATKDSIREWSLNRYFGFYIKKKVNEKIVTPYKPNLFKSNTTILENNILNNPDSNNPFEKDFKKDKTFIEYLGRLYEVVINKNGDYKIIAPIDLEGKEGDVNKEIITFDEDNKIVYNSKYNSNIFEINNFNTADVWVIEINGKYHILKKEGGDYYINSDYIFEVNDNKLEYYVNEGNSSFRTTINLNKVNSDNPPINFKIYKLDFLDIKDFDNNIINTKYANYEYEREGVVSPTQEPKLITENGNSQSEPKDLNNYIYEEELVNIPVTSEYIADMEIFAVDNLEDQENVTLEDIWYKNPKFVKWSQQNSISGNDYPYRLNNNFGGEEYNRTSNPYDTLPKRVERNLDYFYTINPDSNDYLEHSLHLNITDDDGVLDTNYNFDLSNYYNSGTYSNDYFKFIFNKKERLNKNRIIRNTKKYSSFLLQDGVRTNETLFKGIKFKAYEVGDIEVTESDNENLYFDNITISSTNEFDNYDLSIILTEKNYDPISGDIIQESQIDWKIINEWKLEEEYVLNDLILYDNVLYINTATISIIENSVDNPSNSSEWNVYNIPSTPNGTIFWNPNNLYTNGSWVYNEGEFYEVIDANGDIDFYDPSQTYTNGDEVLWKNNYYISISMSNDSFPSDKSKWEKVVNLSNLAGDIKWSRINLFNLSIPYTNLDYVVYQGVLYRSNDNGNEGNIPIENNLWDEIYSFIPKKDTVYNPDTILKMNNEFYYLNDNPEDEVLNSGIDIHINKKYKNVLINIYINDNTMPYLKNINRDELYLDINQRITARNFIDTINNLDQTNGFINETNYYVIQEDLSVERYSIDSNVRNLPYMLVCEDPEEFPINKFSNIRNYFNIPENILKPKFKLSSFEINDLEELNYYNTNPIGLEIVRSNDEDFRKFYRMYRFNGYYEPIFKDIELFKKPTLEEDLGGNYKFDTELTKFGIDDEIIISKVSKRNDLLKLRNTESFKSIYPQLDEFGYTYTDMFIFKSTWDRNYYVKVDK